MTQMLYAYSDAAVGLLIPLDCGVSACEDAFASSPIPASRLLDILRYNGKGCQEPQHMDRLHERTINPLIFGNETTRRQVQLRLDRRGGYHTSGAAGRAAVSTRTG
jgi:hypothetical protein